MQNHNTRHIYAAWYQYGFKYTCISYYKGKIIKLQIKSVTIHNYISTNGNIAQSGEWAKLSSSFGTKSYNRKKNKHDLPYTASPTAQTNLVPILKTKYFNPVFIWMINTGSLPVIVRWVMSHTIVIVDLCSMKKW